MTVKHDWEALIREATKPKELDTPKASWTVNLTKDYRFKGIRYDPLLSFEVSTIPEFPAILTGERMSLSGKSHIAMNLAVEWQGPVLYVATERYKSIYDMVCNDYPELIHKASYGEFLLGYGWPPEEEVEMDMGNNAGLLIVDHINPVLTRMGFAEDSSKGLSKLIDTTSQFDCSKVLVYHPSFVQAQRDFFRDLYPDIYPND